MRWNMLAMWYFSCDNGGFNSKHLRTHRVISWACRCWLSLWFVEPICWKWRIPKSIACLPLIRESRSGSNKCLSKKNSLVADGEYCKTLLGYDMVQDNWRNMRIRQSHQFRSSASQSWDEGVEALTHQKTTGGCGGLPHSVTGQGASLSHLAFGCLWLVGMYQSPVPLVKTR